MYFLPFEKLASRLNNDSQVLHKSECFPRLEKLGEKYYYGFKLFKVFSSVFGKDGIAAVKQLSSNKTVVMCKPAEGRGVVIVDRTKYLDSTRSIISDHTKIEPVNESATKYTFMIEDQISYFVCKLKFADSITSDLCNSFYVSGSDPGILHGIPKFNKPDFKNFFQI